MFIHKVSSIPPSLLLPASLLLYFLPFFLPPSSLVEAGRGEKCFTAHILILINVQLFLPRRIVSHFFDGLNYGLSVAKPKNNGLLRKKNTKGVVLKQKGTRMAEDGED